MGSSGMFGASQGPENKVKESSVTTTKSPEQTKYINEALALYGPQLGQGANVYQGDRIAPFTDLQNQVFDFAKSGGFTVTPEQTGEYFRDVVKNPRIKNFQEITNPAVKEAFSGPGFWGSGRATAQAKASQYLADELGTAWGNLNWDVQQANKQGAIQEFALGTTQQQQEQDVINSEIQKFAEENQITDPENLNILMNLLGMNVMSSSSGVSRQSVTQPSWHTGDWTQFGVEQGAGIAGGM